MTLTIKLLKIFLVLIAMTCAQNIAKGTDDLNVAPLPNSAKMDSIQFNVANIPWLLIKSSDVDSILTLLNRIYPVEENYDFDNPYAYYCMWETQIVILKLDSNWTFVGGWGLLYPLENEADELREWSKLLSGVFGEVHFYLLNHTNRNGWFIYKAGKLVEEYAYAFDELDYLITLVGSEEKEDYYADLLYAGVSNVALVIQQMFRWAPELKNYFVETENHLNFIFTLPMKPDIGKVLISHLEMREQCTQHLKAFKQEKN